MNFDELLKGFSIINFTPNEEQMKQFAVFYNELVEYNNKVNLTAITDVEGFIYKHVIDSLLPFEFFDNNSKILDIGSGAGFPAIPLKIVNKNLKFSCVDSVNKKVVWLNYIKNKLNLDHFNCYHGRCEDLAFDKNFREVFDYVVARGVANLSTLLEYCAPFVKVGGFIVAYKASDYINEIELAQNAIKTLSLEIVEVKSFKNLDKIGDRNILIFKKVVKTPLKYPRKQNKPRINPL